MSAECANKCNLKVFQARDKREWTAANGGKIEVIGDLSTEVDINGIKVPMRIAVAESLGQDFII